MSDFNIINHNDFMIEKIKERPINRKKLMRRMIITASMAVIFGLVACVTILLLEPVISNFLYPEDETASIVTFPEEVEEMEPEDMLADKLQDNQADIQVAESGTVEINVKQIRQISGMIKLSEEQYVQMYNALNIYRKKLEKSVVVVTCVRANSDWLDDDYESENNTSGLVIANNDGKFYILTFAESIEKADEINVTIGSGKTVKANLIQKHSDTGLALLEISEGALGNDKKDVEVTKLGSSKSSSLTGTSVIALGSPMGITDSVAYGMISGVIKDWSIGELTYDMLITDIYGSRQAQGFLFNMEEQVIGVYNTESTNEDMKNIISAYGISDLKPLITTLSSGSQVPYLGINGISVTEEANERLNIPYGAYVTNVIMNSPAMLAGLQKGDIIIRADDEDIDNYYDLERILYHAEVGQVLKLKVMRQSQDMYKEMNMDVTLTGAK